MSINIRTDYSEEKGDSRSKSKYSTNSQKKRFTLKLQGLKIK
jgi:hypothetical protein